MAGYGLDENGNIVALGRQPGLLDDLANYAPGYDYGTILPYRINQKTKQKEFAAPGFIKDMARAITAPARAYYGLLNDPQQQAMEANNIAFNLLGTGGATNAVTKQATGKGTLGAIPVYHGSPHKFDKFDMSKIGTGEGAQAYGHGLYFAESPEVAKTYLDFNGTLPRKYLADGQLIKPKSILESVADDIHTNGIVTARINAKANGGEFLDAFNQLESKKITASRSAGSSLYEVSLRHPDPAKEAATPLSPEDFLQWDKPLSEQPASIQKSLETLGYKYDPQSANAYDDALLNSLFGDANATLPKMPQNPMGSYIARGKGIFDQPQDKVITERLRNAGIPGIRYLDGNSRGAGNGTYNYVVFDDRIPQIINRNGLLK